MDQPSVGAVGGPDRLGERRMSRLEATDPDGGKWRVWRRWYAWKRWITMRDIWQALPGTGGDGRYGGSDLDAILALPLLVLAAIGLAVSLVDLVVQLVALPFVLLARLLRLAAWPVQLDLKNKHIRTERVKGFGAAGELRGRLAAQVTDGSLPGRPVPDPKVATS
jgi:hypothetical protein